MARSSSRWTADSIGSVPDQQQQRQQPEPEEETRRSQESQHGADDAPTRNISEHLLRGYFASEFPGLQLRRTLDQYIYAGIETTSRRDDDQVVYRYTRDNFPKGAKIFMVDQLWLWILGGGINIPPMSSLPHPAGANGGPDR